MIKKSWIFPEVGGGPLFLLKDDIDAHLGPGAGESKTG